MSFTKKDIVKLTGLPPRLVQFYTESNVIIPDADEGKGRGKVRRYTKANLFAFLIIKELSEMKMSISRIREIINLLRKNYLRTGVIQDEGRLESFFKTGFFILHKKANDDKIKLSRKEISQMKELKNNTPVLTIGDLKKYGHVYCIIDLSMFLEKMKY